MAKFATGYDTIDQAVKDNFTKVGGKDRALSVLETGWYQVCQRKEQNMKNQRVRELITKDPRFKGILAEAQKQVKKA